MINLRKPTFFYLIMISIFLQNVKCSKDFSPTDSNAESEEEFEIVYNEAAYYDTTYDANIKGIYAYKRDDHNLYYADYDTFKLELIEGCQDEIMTDMLLNDTHDLLLACSFHRLYFVDTNSNQKVGEIEVPDSYADLGDNIVPGARKLLPCQWSEDHCILVCRSVFLVNLNTLSLERIIWDYETFPTESWIHHLSLGDDGRSLYVRLTYWGSIPIDDTYSWGGLLQKIARIDLRTGQFESIHDYPKEDISAKILYASNDFLMVYNFHTITRFSVHTEKLIDSFDIRLPKYLGENISNYLTEAYSFGSHLIIADSNLSFYLLYPDRKELELYMALPYHSYYGILYQKLKGGDVYACLSVGADDRIKIINLSQKKIIRDLNRNEINLFVLKEGD